MQRPPNKESARAGEQRAALKKLQNDHATSGNAAQVKSDSPPSYSEKMEIKAAWAKRKGLTETRSPRCARRVNGAIQTISGRMTDSLRSTRCGDDHCSLWNKDGKPWGLVSQPYQLTLDNLKAIIERADCLNLDVTISTMPAWHWPGNVLFIEYRIKNDTKYGQESCAPLKTN